MNFTISTSSHYGAPRKIDRHFPKRSYEEAALEAAEEVVKMERPDHGFDQNHIISLWGAKEDRPVLC